MNFLVLRIRGRAHIGLTGHTGLWIHSNRLVLIGLKVDSVKEFCLPLQKYLPVYSLSMTLLFVFQTTISIDHYIADLQPFPFDHMIFQSYSLLRKRTTYKPLNFYILLQLIDIVDTVYLYRYVNWPLLNSPFWS